MLHGQDGEFDLLGFITGAKARNVVTCFEVLCSGRTSAHLFHFLGNRNVTAVRKPKPRGLYPDFLPSSVHPLEGSLVGFRTLPAC